MTMVAPGHSRTERRLAVKYEERARRTGRWGAWRREERPAGFPGTGWTRDVRSVVANDLYAILIRPIATDWGVVQHLAIRTAANREPPWRDKQRIKNELFGADAVAIEVMPPTGELVDAAGMYHMWVLPAGFRLPFTLADRGGGRG